MSAPIARREFAKSVIDRSIRKALATVSRRPRRTFQFLIWNVQARSDLLRPSHYLGRADGICLDRIVGGLLALSGWRREWHRPVEEWESGDGPPMVLFASLADHLMAAYPVPPVLMSAWFRGTGWPAIVPQRWFHRVGQGESLRKAGFPIALTKRMAHEFAHAPASFSIEYALRWAQVRGLSGSDDLARAVAATPLGGEWIDEDDDDLFWVSVIHLFLNTPRIDLGEVGGIVAYLHDRRFEERRAIIGDGVEVNLGPPEPDLSVKGRTFASLLRRAVEWRAEAEDRSKQPKKAHLCWPRSGVNEYRRDHGDGVAWTIRELLDSDALAAEGTAMNHCVATYTSVCSKRKSSIWSLGAEGPDGRDRLLTIEVEPQTRAVVQAKMKGNETADGSCLEILRDWAGREGLNLKAVCEPVA